MKEKVRTSIVQMDIKELDPEANLKRICELIKNAFESHRADLVVFPELANSGYIKLGDAEFSKEYFRVAEPIPGPFTDKLCREAKTHGVFLVVGLLEAHPNIPYVLYNSAVLIGAKGEIAGIHRKIHIPLPERNFFYPGSRIQVFKTELGIIGVQVCADGAFPELSRSLSLKGAEIICTVYNMPDIPGKYFHERIVHSACCRAMENTNYYIACNRIGKDSHQSFVGRSCTAGPYGQLLAMSDANEEQIINATLEEKLLIEARSNSPYLSYRRPDLYGSITEPY